MPIERLSAEDRIMLWPDEIWPQDIGAIAVLDGGPLLDSQGRLRIELVREAVASRLDLVPRLRQLLYVPPPALGGPLWVDAPEFDVASHVRAIQLQPPGDEPQLLNMVEQIRRKRLDPSRPLWEIWLLSGLPESRVGLFVRTHHCVADGMAGVATLGTLLDLSPEGNAIAGGPWKPSAPPTPEVLRADKLRREQAERESRHALLGHPARTVHRLVATWPAMREMLAERALPATSLDRLVGKSRKLALIRTSLDVVKGIAHSHEAKVNDVFLTVIAGGLRKLLLSRGEPVENGELRVYVPISLRRGQYANARGNAIAQMVVTLPVGTADPARRLPLIAAETTVRKMRSRPSVGKMPHRGLMGHAFLKLIDRQHINVTTADLPGPPVPLYLAGARLVEVFSLLPLIGRVSLGVGALSYAGQLNITAVADGEGYPDLQVFAEGVRNELRELDISGRGARVA